MKMMKEYVRNNSKLLNGELRDDYHHADSHVYMYRWSYLEWLCNNQLECENIGLKAFILAYDIISRIMIIMGTLA